MQKNIVSDTSCLILFECLGKLNILKDLFREVYITPEIASEFGINLTPYPWIKIIKPSNSEYQHLIQRVVDKGEASAITLAVENKNSLLILDDEKARKFAQNLNLNYTGSLGVLLEAKEKGIINAVKPILNEIEKQTNFRLTPQLVNKVLKLSQEQ